jgi:hypothetical protein
MYKFILAESQSLVKIAELRRAKNRTLSVALNKPGNSSFNIALTDEVAPYIVPNKTCLKVLFDNEPVWGGPIWSTSKDCAANKMQVNAVGWFETLMKRITKNDLEFLTVDAIQIAKTLMDQADTETIPTGILVSYLEAGQPLFYAPLSKFTSVGGQISAMSELESGFDYEIDADKNLRLYTKKGTDREAVWGFKRGPKNLANCVVDEDGSQTMNRMIVTSNVAPPQQADDFESQTEFGLFEEHVALTSDKIGTDVPLAYAGAEVIVRGRPRITYNLSPMAPNPKRFVPQAFKDFTIGDTGYLYAKQGDAVDIKKQKIRLFGFTVDIDNHEKVTGIQTTAQ